MKKSLTRALLPIGLVLILVAGTACRTRTKPKPSEPMTTPTDTMAPTPTTRVEPPKDDFVEDKPVPIRVDDLRGDIEDVNRTAQARGWIRDAFFSYDESTLTSESQENLAMTASWLKSHAELNLLLEGHCDERGTEQYNLALGDRRAHAAKEYLMNLGVDGSRIRTVSYGEERPFAMGANETAFSQNRRAHLVLVRK